MTAPRGSRAAGQRKMSLRAGGHIVAKGGHPNSRNLATPYLHRNQSTGPPDDQKFPIWVKHEAHQASSAKEASRETHIASFFAYENFIWYFPISNATPDRPYPNTAHAALS